jgi:heptosyltransferase II
MIGDVLTSSILFELLRKHYPDSQLDYLINEHTYPVVEGNPFIDNFIFYTKEIEKSKIKLLKFAYKLRGNRYDVVIDIYSKLSSNLITLFSGSKVRISKHKPYTSFIYNHTFKNIQVSKKTSGLAIENRIQFLSPLEIDASYIPKPKIHLSNNEVDKAKKYLISKGVDFKKPLLMVNVMGSSKNKSYPKKYMSKVVDQIIEQKPNSQIIFNYMPKQKTEAIAIYNLCKRETKACVFLDVFASSLRDFLALTSCCNALIGNEGGATNMAKALNISTFTIFSPWIEKSVWSVFEDGKTNVSVHLSDYNKEDYKDIKDYRTLKKDASELYSKFDPMLFEKTLKRFLKNV